MNNLIERLRDPPCEQAWTTEDGLFAEAADALEAKDKEIERLKAYNDEHQSLAGLQDMRIDSMREALAWLASEIERDHELDRLSIDSEDCAKAAQRLLSELKK